MKVLLSKQASKYLERMNEPDKSRIKAALFKLGENPPQGDIRPMSGRNEYRARIGEYRLLFKNADGAICVLYIAPRGQVYKGR
jgi:mRNA interferase RelE/StbE